MANLSGLLVIERILRDRDGIWDQIGEERDLNKLSGQMLASSAFYLACYGAVLGSSSSALQAVVSAVKLPLLFVATLAICLPTLYLFNLVFGARLQVRQALALVLVSITVISALSIAFAPISLFFRITANHYAFFKLLNVGILALTAIVGLRFLTAGMAALNRFNEVRAAMAFAAAMKDAGTAPTSPAPAGAAAKPAEGEATAVKADGDKPAEPKPDDKTAGEGGTPAPAPALMPAAAVPMAAPAQQVVVAPMQVPVPGPGYGPAPVPVGAGMRAPIGIPLRAGNGAPVMYPAGHPMARPMPAQAAVPTEKQASMTLLYVWILLFGFVGTQLAWTLRPFFGSPDKPFQIFRSIDGNFYVDILRTLGHLF